MTLELQGILLSPPPIFQHREYRRMPMSFYFFQRSNDFLLRSPSLTEPTIQLHNLSWYYFTGGGEENFPSVSEIFHFFYGSLS